MSDLPIEDADAGEIDTSKIGRQAARAMDYIEGLKHKEDMDFFEISEVMIVVMIDRLQPSEDNPDRTETITYVGCSNEALWAKLGILSMAQTSVLEGDEENGGEDE